MSNKDYFEAAPMSGMVYGVTIVSTLLLIGSAVIIWFLPGNIPLVIRITTSIVPLLIIIGTAMYLVRGYSIKPDYLGVQRLFWETQLPLTRVNKIVVDSEAMRGSLRVFGNGGFLGFFGLFKNKKLGYFRAYATNPKHSVVLMGDKRSYLITPEHPRELVDALYERLSRRRQVIVEYPDDRNSNE
ncbi:MAG: PH domain-containing protein [Verrucomicrobia bacterium]|nr:PH domain-containing protein [Verrucomicrobiota bacterium]MCF7708307.1 PH domain-containing protein [Verrucomicrobiota bacterium]